jgi:hypothetical protein
MRRAHLTAARIERLAIGVPATRVAAVAEIEETRFLRHERGELALRPEEESARRRALEFLAAEPGAQAAGR